jgi:hypothetical protein
MRPPSKLVRFGLSHRRTGADPRKAAMLVLVETDHTPEIEAWVAATGADLVRKPIKPAPLRALLTAMLA